ncbi:MAG: phospholipase D-like domain-containing protein [Verrucomicrobiota bacterium]|jgi:phosphatidylserine/phosphatidylglycerophosphate/cardiolipin synthase-like enzyme|nr:phospholipase D-like domain-containing protein [Verrucomicrobiota bacterium]
MKDHEVKALFKTTLEDFQLSRNERGEIRDLLDVVKDNEQKRALFRSMAFDEAREALGKADAGKRFQVIDWLENTVKALYPAENLPGAAKGAAASAWFSPNDNCVGKINDMFAQARASVDICVFTITDNRIVEAIEKAHRRRVQIRVISDDDKAMDAGSDIERLDRMGLQVRVDKSEHHMHHKFAIFDKCQLLSGSYNWTRSAALNNDENFLVTSDLELLKAYTRMFDKLWRNFS